MLIIQLFNCNILCQWLGQCLFLKNELVIFLPLPTNCRFAYFKFIFQSSILNHHILDLLHMNQEPYSRSCTKLNFYQMKDIKNSTGCPKKRSALGMKHNSLSEVFKQSKNGYFGVLSTSLP